MRYNLSQFNFTRFNIGAKRDVFIRAERDALITVHAVAGGQKTVHASIRVVSIAVNAITDLIVLVKAERFVDIIVGSSVDMYIIMVSSNRDVKITMNSIIHVSKIMSVHRGVLIDIQTEVHVGKIIRNSVRNSIVNVMAVAHAGKLMCARRTANIFVNARVNLSLVRYQEAFINVTIPPRGEIRIDSSLFTLTLGLENILHLHSGDWITFNRDTVQVRAIASSGGQIIGEILYNERYI